MVRWRSSAPVVPVAVAAAASLWWPEHSDQAVFDVGARGLVSGLVYDRDLWDLKQPGIYWFHALGEWLLPGGLGARLLEALLAVAGGWLVLRITAGRGLHPAVRAAAPSLVLLPYLLAAYSDGVGQIESLLVVLQLAVVAGTWPVGDASVPEGGATRLRGSLAWGGAGVCVGAVALLKTLYLPIPLLLVVGAVVASRRTGVPGTAGRVAAGTVGAALTVGVALVHLALHGALRTALVTTFVLPLQVVGGADLHPSFALWPFVRGALAAASLTGPLALLALVTLPRRPAAAWQDLTLAATAVVAALLGTVQLWTPYRLLMIAAPLGLLAVSGADVVVRRLSRWATPGRHAPAARGTSRLALGRTAAAVAAGVLLLPALYGPADLLLSGAAPVGLDLASRVARAPGAAQPGGPAAVAALVRREVAPGTPAVVLGDQRVLELLGSRPGTEVFGVSLWLMPDDVLVELARELDRSRPAWLYVEAGEQDRISRRGSPGARALADVLAGRYRRQVGTDTGAWFRAVTPGPALPQPGGVRLDT